MDVIRKMTLKLGVCEWNEEMANNTSLYDVLTFQFRGGRARRKRHRPVLYTSKLI